MPSVKLPRSAIPVAMPAFGQGEGHKKQARLFEEPGLSRHLPFANQFLFIIIPARVDFIYLLRVFGWCESELLLVYRVLNLPVGLSLHSCDLSIVGGTCVGHSQYKGLALRRHEQFPVELRLLERQAMSRDAVDLLRAGV